MRTTHKIVQMGNKIYLFKMWLCAAAVIIIKNKYNKFHDVASFIKAFAEANNSLLSSIISGYRVPKT